MMYVRADKIKKIESLFVRNRFEYGWGKWCDGPRNFYEHSANLEIKELIQTTAKVRLGEATSKNIGQLRRKLLLKKSEMNIHDRLRIDNLNCYCYRELAKIQQEDEYDEDYNDYDLLPVQHRLEKAYLTYKDKLDAFNSQIEQMNMLEMMPIENRLIEAYDKYLIELNLYNIKHAKKEVSKPNVLIKNEAKGNVKKSIFSVIAGLLCLN